MSLTLIVHVPGAPDPARVLFDRERATLGRSSSCDVQLRFGTISGHHMTFERERAVWRVRDEGSTNGTSLDGAPLVPGQYVPLEHGARLTVLEITFEIDLTEDLDPEGFTLSGDTGGLTRQLLAQALRAADGEDADVAYLELLEGPDAGRRFPLHDEMEQAFIGAAQGALIRLHDPDAPARAVTFTRHGFGFEVTPGDEAAPTLDGAPLTETTPLVTGQVLAVGPLSLSFRDPLDDDDLLPEALRSTPRAAPTSSTTEAPAPAPQAADSTPTSTDAPDEPPAPEDSEESLTPGAEAHAPSAASRGVRPLDLAIGALVLLVLAVVGGLLYVVFAG